MSERRTTRVPLPSGVELAVDIYTADSGTVDDEPCGALIAVHGFGSGRRGGKIEELGTALPAFGWTVIALDLQGHGDSGGGFDLTTVARSIGDVRRVAELPEFRDAPRRVLVGSSFGGVVAAWAAVEDPTLCDRLALIAPAFGFLDRYLLTLPDDERAAWEGGATHALRVPHLAGQELAASVLNDRTRHSWRRLAELLVTPTLIIHGLRDETVPWQATIDFTDASERDDLDVILLGGGDHRLAEQMGELTHHIHRFASGNDSCHTRPDN